MTIQDLGSLGEFIAAIATVATLAYLAVQIRQNTRAVRAAAHQTQNQNVQPIIAVIAASPENASVFRRGLADFDCLSPEEQMQFIVVLLGVFNNSNSAHTNHRNGLLSDEDWRREWGTLRFYLESNGGRRVWEIARSLDSLSASFIEFAEKELLNRDP